MLDIIIYSVLFIGCSLVTAFLIKEKRKSKDLYQEIAKLFIEKSILLDKLSEAFDALQQKPLEQTDGFVKFLEESRNNAFEFIDVMQNSIKQFENQTQEIFAKERLSADLKQIKQAYQELKAKTLPTDTPNN